MYLWIRILVTLLFTICVTIVLFVIKNRSNISVFIIIPVIASLLTKYTLGDWDKDYQFTILDIAYWISILSVSYCTICLLSKGFLFS
jgi:ACR3 family arsenite efflux pump ArsB